MFNSAITTSLFANEATHPIFSKITGSPYINDVSLISTMRALLMGRMGEEDEITLYLSNSELRRSTVENNSVVDVINAMIGSKLGCEANMFQIHSFNGSGVYSDVDFMMDFVQNNFINTYEHFYRVEKITTFFSKIFRVLCYISPELKSTIFFVQNLDYAKLHAIQMAIIPALPWYFNKDFELLPAEMDLVKSLQDSSPDRYVECLGVLADKYDLPRLRVKTLLTGVETKHLNKACMELENNIAKIADSICEYNTTIGQLYAKKDSCLNTLLGIRAKLKESNEESELANYFVSNKKLHLDDVVDSAVYFSVADDITYYDPDMAERMLADSYGYIEESYTQYANISREGMKKLLTSIFIDEVLHIKFCAKYMFRINGNIDALSMGSEMPFQNCMKNPHIDRYHCMGGYEQTINEVLEHHDYIGAIEQCIASCKSLNFGDSFVMNAFVTELYNTHDRIIRLPDGTYVTPKTAVKWLDENSEERVEDE